MCSRTFASVSGTPLNPTSVGPYQVFDRNAKRLQRDRAATREGGERSRTVDYVRENVADALIERLMDIKRKFQSILDLGSGPGHFSKMLEKDITEKVVMLDLSEKTLHRDSDGEFEVQVERIRSDEENFLEVIPRNSQEAIVSCLQLALGERSSRCACTDQPSIKA